MIRLSHLRVTHLIVAVILLSPFATAEEDVLLTNGFHLHADHHELVGDVVRLYAGSGFTEVPVASVAGYEAVETTSPSSPASQLQVTEKQDVHTTLAPPDLAVAAARKYQLPDDFVRSVMKAESGFRADAVSPKGALGLMQLMPDTARQLGIDPRDPAQNVEGGAEYLRELLARYENDPNQVLLALAAYNAGPQAVERFHGVPPYPETRAYILQVLKNWHADAKK